jgi:hypothetical protein
MKELAVVIRNVTDKLKIHKRRHCESEEFWAGHNTTPKIRVQDRYNTVLLHCLS